MRRVLIPTLALGLAASWLGGLDESASASQRGGDAEGDQRKISNAGRATQAHHHGHDRVAGVGRLSWGRCEDPNLIDVGAECSMLSVPLDYSRSHGTKIKLAVSRVKHTVPDSQWQGVMLVNPGGPQSGLVYAFLGQLVPDEAGGSYDWIGFDPRGVGASVPALSCLPDRAAGPRPDYTPATRATEDAWLKRSMDYAKACRRNGGTLLDHLKTTDHARDLNAIRSALGERRINYYGFSWGTYLGQVFATMFPDRMRRMILDSSVDPRRVWYASNLDQDDAFEKTIQTFFAWVARHDGVYHLGETRADVEAAFYAAQDKLRAAPRGSLGPDEWGDAFVPAGYNQAAWLDVAGAFAAFINHGDAAPATAGYEAADSLGNDNGYAVALGTFCTDSAWPRDWSVWHRDNTRVATDAPFFTWGNAWFNAPCAFWSAKPGRPVDVGSKHLPRFLMFDETLDAATPFSGSLEVRKRFPSATLIATVGGTSHANTLIGNACVDSRIAAYLADGTLPQRQPGRGPDVTCAPIPEPEPSPTTTQTAGPVDNRHLAARIVRIIAAGR